MSQTAAETTKHTPGPWHIAEYGTRSDGGPKHIGIVKRNVTIANLGTSDRDNAEELEANARLIAAAPDLLSSLKELRAVYQWFSDNLPPQVMMRLCREGVSGVEDDFDGRADAAIAKAERGA